MTSVVPLESSPAITNVIGSFFFKPLNVADQLLWPLKLLESGYTNSVVVDVLARIIYTPVIEPLLSVVPLAVNGSEMPPDCTPAVGEVTVSVSRCLLLLGELWSCVIEILQKIEDYSRRLTTT